MFGGSRGVGGAAGWSCRVEAAAADEAATLSESQLSPKTSGSFSPPDDDAVAPRLFHPHRPPDSTPSPPPPPPSILHPNSPLFHLLCLLLSCPAFLLPASLPVPLFLFLLLNWLIFSPLSHLPCPPLSHLYLSIPFISLRISFVRMLLIPVGLHIPPPLPLRPPPHGTAPIYYLSPQQCRRMCFPLLMDVGLLLSQPVIANSGLRTSRRQTGRVHVTAQRQMRQARRPPPSLL